MSEPDGRLGGGERPDAASATPGLWIAPFRVRWPVSKALRGPLIDRLAGIVQDRRANPT